MSDQNLLVWLDDERPAPPGYIHVKTPQEAIELLKTNKVARISLDNDLGLVGVSPPNEGRHVAQWIERAAFEGTLKRLHVAVHTQNSVAAKEMKQALRNAFIYWINNVT